MFIIISYCLNFLLKNISNKIYKQLIVNKRMFEKRGQVTIFIIIALVLVASVALFFFFRTKGIQKVGVGEEVEIDAFLKTCLEDKVYEGIELIGIQGGYVNLNGHLQKTFKFDDEKTFMNFSYLCYTRDYYAPCVPQEPVLMNRLKKELKNYISQDTEACFNGLASSFEKKGYEVKKDYKNFDIELTYDKMLVKINGKLTLDKSGEVKKYDDAKFLIQSSLYNTGFIVQRIINEEVKFCDFDELEYAMTHSKESIKKFVTGEEIKIYTILNKNTNEQFRFAVRGCVFPPGA